MVALNTMENDENNQTDKAKCAINDRYNFIMNTANTLGTAGGT